MRPTDDHTYHVNEIFYSLQGEGFHSGMPAVFLRLSGCNLRCPFCDTDHASSTQMKIDDIVADVSRYPSRHIIITGGEPALQIDTAIIDALHEAGFTIHIETNGTLPLPDGIDWITCSPKDAVCHTPKSRVVLDRIDEIKIVYTGQDVEAQISQLPKARYYALQPCSGQNTDDVVAYILDHPHWRLSLQTHKIINIP